MDGWERSDMTAFYLLVRLLRDRGDENVALQAVAGIDHTVASVTEFAHKAHGEFPG